ncbi:sugar phosphate isomerase/epimerase family protein [Agrobacterium tumefaciens]|uniref:sugar phosphate isomerase/epimerase family protein n=1 Tax=Agrobacterium tumefaciens TaxID=358 RepID=UPI001571BF73|nr:sugar phosphate isomerase/epimerase [Agrobacterium tumefaciens]
MISVSHLTALDASPEDFICHAADAGFDAVGLRINPPVHTPDQWPVAGDITRAKALRRIADDLGIAILEIETFSIWPDFTIEKLLPGLEAGAELGARFVLSAGIDDEQARLVENYGTLCDAAAGFGLTVGLEFMPFRPMATLVHTLRTIEAVNRPNAKLLIDTLHLDRSGSGVSEITGRVRDHLGYVHLCDAVAKRPSPEKFAEEARNARFYPGEGVLPLADIVRALPQAAAFSIEAPNPHYRHLAPAERIRIAGEKTRAFFNNIRAQAPEERTSHAL